MIANKLRYLIGYSYGQIRYCSMLRHQPVLLDTVVKLLAPADGNVYVDATFGGGGHSSALLHAAPHCRIYALDADPLAIDRAKQLASTPNCHYKLKAIHCRFGQMEDKLIKVEKLPPYSVDGILFDLGMSSMQIDDPSRGFSFRFSGPLDMRMNATSHQARNIKIEKRPVACRRQGNYIRPIGPQHRCMTAAHVINNIDEDDLADIIWTYGEDRKARKIAKSIVIERKKQPILTTDHLVDIIDRRFPYKYRHEGQIHPATRTFQAIRIFINDELYQIVDGLNACKRLLKNGGRLVVISFHSLEDRIVKRFLNGQDRPDFTSRSNPSSSKSYARLSHDNKSDIRLNADIKIDSPWKLITKRPIYPSPEEMTDNPRSTSAKLRYAIYDPQHTN